MNTNHLLRHWPANVGRPPSQKALKMAQQVARPGSKESIAVAMAMRPVGATQRQIIQVLGQPHRNKLKQLVEDNKVKLEVKPSKDGVTVYKINLK